MSKYFKMLVRCSPLPRAAALLLLALGAEGCKERAGHAPSVALAIEPPGDAAPLDEPFESLYALFLRHKVGQGPKAALWSQRYRHHWVRWSGEIRSFTDNGITVRQLPITGTFDVSLKMNGEDRKRALARFRVGDSVTYVGRLESYDDIWRTFYLINGAALDSPRAVVAPPAMP